MKKQQNKIDDYFKEALQDHKIVPSEAARQAFLKEAATLDGSRKSKRYWYFYIAAFLLFVSAGAGFLLIHQDAVKKNSSSSSLKYRSSSNSLPDKTAKPTRPAEQSESGSIVKNELVLTKNPSQKITITSQEKNQGIIPVRNHQRLNRN